MIYRNIKTGREVELEYPDTWLDASAGWEVVAESDTEPTPVGDEEDL